MRGTLVDTLVSKRGADHTLEQFVVPEARPAELDKPLRRVVSRRKLAKLDVVEPG